MKNARKIKPLKYFATKSKTPMSVIEINKQLNRGKKIIVFDVNNEIVKK